jgi:hypothetical protein
MPSDPSEKHAAGLRWLENWKAAADVLENERWNRLRSLTDEAAWSETEALFALWEPDWTGDAGEGLILQQAVFIRAQRRRHAT